MTKKNIVTIIGTRPASGIGVTPISPVYLVERSRVPEAAIPHLVDGLGCLHIVFALRSAHDGQHGSPSHAVLVVVGEGEDFVLEEFVGPSTFAAEVARPDLQQLMSHEDSTD
jgi:hypothetical protein